MKPIRSGDRGLAVEDIQQRLLSLGYGFDDETVDGVFGEKTEAAVRAFRVAQGLSDEPVIDFRAWSALVDETFSMGDRSLYLRVPNFHGNDVRTLQNALSVLGFSAGATDGIFGVHTENALREFQANVGLNDDGIAFEDTFDAINRLHHVWTNKKPSSHPEIHMGLARTAEVLEDTDIVLVGTDPIARNIAGRIWNIAAATTDASGIVVVDKESHSPVDPDLVITISCELESIAEGMPTVAVSNFDLLASRLLTAIESTEDQPPHIAVVLQNINHYDGTFTAKAAQKLAIGLLDALCTTLSK